MKKRILPSVGVFIGGLLLGLIGMQLGYHYTESGPWYAEGLYDIGNGLTVLTILYFWGFIRIGTKP